MASFVGAGVTTDKGSGVTTVNLPIHASSAAGQLAIASYGGNTATAVGAQSGFTTKGDRQSTGDTLAPCAWIGVRTLDATDISNGFVTLGSVPSAAGVGACQTWDGLTTTDDFTVVYVDKTAGTTFVFASQTITQEVAVVYMTTQATVTLGSMSVNNSFTETNDRVSRNLSMGYRLYASAGSTGATTVTSTQSTRGVGLMIGLQATASAAGPTPRRNDPSRGLVMR